MPERIKKIVDDAKAGLAKLEAHVGTVYRGTGQDLMDFYDIEPGQKFCDPAFFSTSKSKEVAHQFAQADCPFGGIVFVVSSKKAGKFIGELASADVKKEEEVLFPPSTQFLITQVKETEEGCFLVYMDEIIVEHAEVDAVSAGNEDQGIQTPVQASCVDDSNVSQPTGSTVNLDGMGTQWVDGLRRSARLQPQLGSVFVNGLRRSARLL
jgi:hypothetical protein